MCILQMSLHNIKLPLCYPRQLLTSGQHQLHLFLTNESFYVYIKHTHTHIYIGYRNLRALVSSACGLVARWPNSLQCKRGPVASQPLNADPVSYPVARGQNVARDTELCCPRRQLKRGNLLKPFLWQSSGKMEKKF
jgi:hypothetical protein